MNSCEICNCLLRNKPTVKDGTLCVRCRDAINNTYNGPAIVSLTVRPKLGSNTGRVPPKKMVD